MMPMICRMRRAPPLLPTNILSMAYKRTWVSISSSASVAATSHASASRSPHALNVSYRSSLFRASTAVVLDGNAQQRKGYSTVGDGDFRQPLIQLRDMRQQRRELLGGIRQMSTDKENGRSSGVRLSSLLCKHMGLSRRQSERMILTERVTLFGSYVTSPTFEMRPSNDPNQNSSTAMKVDGKLIPDIHKTLKLMHEEQKRLNEEDDSTSSSDGKGKVGKKNARENLEFANTRVWLANKLKGELITEDDPVGRPSMLQRLSRGGVGQNYKKGSTPIHLKAIGRLDMMTEGLMIFTNDGKYARELELPSNKLWRTYRIRVHGRLTPGKMRAMRKGLTVRMNDNLIAGDRPSGEVVRTGRMMKYKGIKVSIERSGQKGRGGKGGGGTNTWLRVTCTEGKNRQLRRIMSALGLDATRLIRVSYGDYDLNTIPPGKAVEVPCKWLDRMKSKGTLSLGGDRKKNEKEEVKNDSSESVQWVNYS